MPNRDINHEMADDIIPQGQLFRPQNLCRDLAYLLIIFGA